MAKKKKILVWDGIIKGYNYITEEEEKERKVLQKKMQKDFFKVLLWILGLTIGFLILFFLFSL